ncbi:MAG: hypothetical protein GXP62_15185 [Oligoflexia bacterium]|nr:hypothetical protein [Oligoflexia bacterium]
MLSTGLATLWTVLHLSFALPQPLPLPLPLPLPGLRMAGHRLSSASSGSSGSHTGSAPKVTNPTPQDLSAAEQAQLVAGKAVRKQVKYQGGGRGVSVMDVHGSSEQVWAVIDDFSSYPDWIDDLDECEVYGRTEHQVLVRFKLRVLGRDVEYFIDHNRRPDLGYMTWQLDYSRDSDIDDSTGYWLVYAAPGHPGYTRVEYSVDLRVKGWVPAFVEDMLANKGLDKATSWVKVQVEG